MPVPTVTIPYMAGESVDVISVARAHRMQRISWMLATGRSRLMRMGKSESEDEQEEVELLLLKDIFGGRDEPMVCCGGRCLVALLDLIL